jgi:hypothetical protein
MPKFIIDHTSLLISSTQQSQIDEYLTEFNETLVRFVDRGKTVEKFTEAWDADVLPSVSLVNLLYNKEMHNVDPVVIEALSISINRTVDIDTKLDWTDIIQEYNAKNVAVALLCVIGNTPSLCKSYATSISVFDKVSSVNFYRHVFEIENVSEANFFEIASAAFPSLIFCSERVRFNRFHHNYDEIRRLVIKHLGALNDDFCDQINNFKGNQANVSSHFSAVHGIDMSQESSRTHNNSRAMDERRVIIEGVEYMCEWHTKLFPTIDRIHFCMDVRLENQHRVIVGIFTSHLAT